MIEQKITPVLSDDERMRLWEPYRNFPVGWINDYASDVEQAALAKQGAVRDQALRSVVNAHTYFERAGEVCSFEGQPMIYAATLIELADQCSSALKDTPAAAVADTQPVAWFHEPYLGVASDGTEMYGARRLTEHAPPTTDRNIIALGPLAAQPSAQAQPSANAGPLAAVEARIVQIACQIPGSSEPKASLLYRDLRAAIAASKEGASHE